MEMFGIFLRVWSCKVTSSTVYATKISISFNCAAVCCTQLPDEYHDQLIYYKSELVAEAVDALGSWQVR